MAISDIQSAIKDIDKYLRKTLPPKSKTVWEGKQNVEKTVLILDVDNIYSYLVTHAYILYNPYFLPYNAETIETQINTHASEGGTLSQEELSDFLQDSSGKKLGMNATKEDIKAIDSIPLKALANDIYNTIYTGLQKAPQQDTKVEFKGNLIILYTNPDGKSADKYRFLGKYAFTPANTVARTFFAQNLKRFSDAFSPGGLGAPASGLSTQRGQFDVIDIGHMFSSGRRLRQLSTRVDEMFSEASKNSELTDKQKANHKKAKAEITELITEIAKRNKVVRDEAGTTISLNKEHLIDMAAGKALGEGVTYVTVESSPINRAYFNKFEGETLKQINKAIGEYLKDNAALLEGSPSMVEDTATILVDYTVKELSTKKVKTKRLKVKRSSGAKVKVRSGKHKTSYGLEDDKIRGHSPKKFLNNNKRKRSAPPIQDTVTNLTNMQAIINEHLHEYLQKNMGKGSSKLILNYRTGRFAKSAELVALKEVQGSRGAMIEGIISYLRNPYDVFAPGGKLHKDPGRDPQKLINKSIRQIMKDKALAALSFRSVVQ